MEIVGSRRKSTLSSAGDSVPTLPLYRSAPELEVRLEDFEQYAVQRLRGFFIFVCVCSALRSDCLFRSLCVCLCWDP